MSDNFFAHEQIVEEIREERSRQKIHEGFDAAHDDTHDQGELALAAARYAGSTALSDEDRKRGAHIGTPWPWDGRRWWKPTTRRRDLVKAAALIVAEIERLDRSET